MPSMEEISRRFGRSGSEVDGSGRDGPRREGEVARGEAFEEEASKAGTAARGFRSQSRASSLNIPRRRPASLQARTGPIDPTRPTGALDPMPGAPTDARPRSSRLGARRPRPARADDPPRPPRCSSPPATSPTWPRASRSPGRASTRSRPGPPAGSDWSLDGRGPGAHPRSRARPRRPASPDWMTLGQGHALGPTRPPTLAGRSRGPEPAARPRAPARSRPTPSSSRPGPST